MMSTWTNLQIFRHLYLFFPNRPVGLCQVRKTGSREKKRENSRHFCTNFSEGSQTIKGSCGHLFHSILQYGSWLELSLGMFGGMSKFWCHFEEEKFHVCKSDEDKVEKFLESSD